MQERHIRGTTGNGTECGCHRLGTGSVEPFMERLARYLGTRAHPQLGQDALDVALYGPLRHVEALGDLPVRQGRGHQPATSRSRADRGAALSPRARWPPDAADPRTRTARAPPTAVPPCDAPVRWRRRDDGSPRGGAQGPGRGSPAASTQGRRWRRSPPGRSAPHGGSVARGGSRPVVVTEDSGRLGQQRQREQPLVVLGEPAKVVRVRDALETGHSSHCSDRGSTGGGAC